MNRIYKDKPFVIKWTSRNSNRNYINRFDTIEQANKRIEFLKIHGITEINWIKGKSND